VDGLKNKRLYKRVIDVRNDEKLGDLKEDGWFSTETLNRHLTSTLQKNVELK
jgi:hypothetical protein